MSADPAAFPRLAELCGRYALDRGQQAQLAAVLSALQADQLAPTTVTAPHEAVDVHVADSLVAHELDVVRSARMIADIGAGAGFPGVPLAVALPDAEVHLVESVAHRCAWLRSLLARAGVRNASVQCTRAEAWPEGVGRHDLVLARALAPQPVVLEYAAPLLRVGGSLIDWRGVRAPAQEAKAALAADLLGLSRPAIHRVSPYPAARDHHLHVFTKVAETPERFPRRPGIARKRPLGG